MMFWKLAEPLVKAMKDRLLELYSEAQRRQMKLIDAVKSSSITKPRSDDEPNSNPSSQINKPAAADVLSPKRLRVIRKSSASNNQNSMQNPTQAFAPPADHSETHSNNAVTSRGQEKPLPQSLTRVLSDVDKNIILSTADSNNMSSPQRSPKHSNNDSWDVNADPESSRSPNPNRWANRAQGYELFGRKIIPGTSAANLNKFTLDLSEDTVKIPNAGRRIRPDINSSHDKEYEVDLDDNDTESNHDPNPTKLVREYEECDDVMLGGSDSDDDDDDKVNTIFIGERIF
jgi:hypothetical protein